MNLHRRSREHPRRESSHRTPLLVRLGDGLIAAHQHIPFRWADDERRY